MRPIDLLDLQPILRKRSNSIVDSLHQALTNVLTAPQNAPETRDCLIDLTNQIIDCLLAKSFNPHRAETLGISLARICPMDLESYVPVPALFGQQLTEGLLAEQIIALQPRLTTLVSYLTIGFYRQIYGFSSLNETKPHINETLWQANVECRRTQTELRTSESRLNSILSAMADLVFAFDSEGRFIFHHSPRIDGLYVPPEGFLGKKHSEVMPSRMQAPFADALEKNKRGEVTQYEYWLAVDDRIRWFSVKMSPVFLDGEFTSSVAVAREITEVKEMQRELQQVHAELERRVERRTARLKVLHEIDQAILAVRSPKAIAEVALHHIRRLIPCMGGVISLFDVHPGSILVLAAEINDQLAMWEKTQLSLETFDGNEDLLHSLQQGDAYMLEDTLSVVQPSTIIQVLKDWGVRALFSIPLVIGNQSIGAISLAMDEPGPLAPEHADIAGEVANSLAVGIQQSRLLEEARASRSRLRRLTQQIISTQEEERRRLSRAARSDWSGLDRAQNHPRADSRGFDDHQV